MLAGLIIFVVLIVAHEYGHFLVAKRNGVEAEEFGIGFPPKIAGKTFGKGIFRTHYSINLLPLGGFVRLKGENETDKRKGSYGAAKFSVKAKIILAGVAANALIAVVVFSIQSVTGMPQLFEGQVKFDNFVKETSYRVAVAEVEENSPAELLGLSQGDVIVSIAGQKVASEVELRAALTDNKSQTVAIEFQDNGKTLTKEVALLSGEDDSSILGVVPLDLVEVKHELFMAPIVGVATAGQMARVTIAGFASSIARLLSGNFTGAVANVAGPVGIFSILSSLENVGIDYLIFFAAILSLTLAVMNVLPLPALDGGRLAMSVLMHSKKLRISSKKEELVHVIGFMILIILAIAITVVDINRLRG